MNYFHFIWFVALHLEHRSASRMNIAMFLPINDEATTPSTEYLTSGLLHSTGDTRTLIDKSDTAASTSSLEGVISSSSNTPWDCSSFPDGTHPWLENDTYTREYEHLGEPLSCTDAYLNTLLSISHFSEPSTLDFSRSDQPAVERSILPAPASFQWETFLSPDAVLPSVQPPSPVPFSEFLSTATTIAPGYLSYQTSMGNRHESPEINNFCAPRAITSPSLHVPKPIFDVRTSILSTLLLHTISQLLIRQAPRKKISGWGDIGVSAPEDSSFPPNKKRQGHSVVSRESSVDNEEVGILDPLTEEDDAENDDQNDLDDYHPARSSSPSIAPSHSGTLRRPTSVKRGRTAKSKKGKAKGSAALALAVITQLGEARCQKQNPRQSSADLDEFDPIRVYREGGCVVRKRKNQPIPVPVPIPNLNKNCRGRKVPFVAENFAALPSADDDTASPIRTLNTDLGERVKKEEDCYLPKPKRTRRKGNSNALDENATTRSYVCTLSGCGKCFVRGEHLKRHVRSIHTHDKRKYLFFL